MQISSINPSTREVVGEVTQSTEAEITQKVYLAHQALKPWRELGVIGRVLALHKVVDILSNRHEELATLASKEMGMPITQSRGDVIGAVEYFQWYLDHAEKYLAPEITYEDDTQIHEVHFEPVGVVAAITPWNFPASNFVWMCGQNLVVGNTVVFKHSEEVPLWGKLIEEVFTEANLPIGVFSEVYGAGDVGNFLVHQDINMICFTGSTTVGQLLYRVGAEKFIRVFLELGGSAPGIIFEDANVDEIINTVFANRFDNCGQICDGLKRLIVHESRVNEVIEKLTHKLSLVTISNALNETTNIGPLVSEKQLTTLITQVQDAIDHGAHLEYQKEVPADLNGFFHSPTILTNVNSDMKVWREEVFGPVLPVVTFTTEEEAIQLANDTQYGLGGYVFTQNSERFLRVAKQIQTGMVQMNTTGYVRPPTPFGGCKMSGIGREHGKYGFHELCNLKTISREK